MSAPFMQLYVADYLGDTRHLTTEQHGAYLLLLMTMWRSGGRLPNEPRRLARITCCTPSRWARISDEVLRFFDVDGECLTHGRLMLELEKASEKSIKRAASGSLGGKAKALKYNEAVEANASGLPFHSSEPEPDKKESPLPPKGEKKARRKPETALPDGFPDLKALQEAKLKVQDAGAAVKISSEAERFRNHAAQTDRRARDWPAAWRNWILNAIERAPALGLVTQQQTGDDHDPWPYRMRVWERQEGWNDVDWGPEPGQPGCRVPPQHLKIEAAE